VSQPAADEFHTTPSPKNDLLMGLPSRPDARKRVPPKEFPMPSNS
jgi:hypothetical protein